jgi:hypothetical protein
MLKIKVDSIYDKMRMENSIKMRINKPVLKRWENRKNA